MIRKIVLNLFILIIMWFQFSYAQDTVVEEISGIARLGDELLLVRGEGVRSLKLTNNFNEK